MKKWYLSGLFLLSGCVNILPTTFKCADAPCPSYYKASKKQDIL